MRIVRVANFVTARSGGLRTALRELGAGFEAAGHEAVLVVPGPRARVEMTEYGRVVTLPGPEVPGMGGYRVLLDRGRLAATLAELQPDRLEVSDRTTLRWLGRWARQAGVPSMMVSHESLDGLLRLFGPTRGPGLLASRATAPASSARRSMSAGFRMGQPASAALFSGGENPAVSGASRVAAVGFPTGQVNSAKSLASSVISAGTSGGQLVPAADSLGRPVAVGAPGGEVVSAGVPVGQVTSAGVPVGEAVSVGDSGGEAEPAGISGGQVTLVGAFGGGAALGGAFVRRGGPGESGGRGLAAVRAGSARWVADRLNGRTAAEFDTVVCTTRWAAAEFERIGARNVVRVPLGVDLEWFSPARWDLGMRRRWAADGDLLLLHCGRLSAEKRPRRSLQALAELRAAGVPAVLAVAGGGPLRVALQREAAERGLPVRFLGHVGDRRELAALLATADIAIAPGPVETFGLAALEALASGTPVVVSAESALPEVIGDAGIAAPGEGPAYAAAVRALAARPVQARRQAARAQAERYPWSAAVAGFLEAHRVSAGSPAAEPV